MAKRQGLRLSLPGAPNTPHTVPGVPGFFRSDIATPVGGKGELDVAVAKKLAADEGTHLELVDLKPSEVKEAEELATRTLKEARAGIAAARKDQPVGAEVERVKDEQASAAKE